MKPLVYLGLISVILAVSVSAEIDYRFLRPYLNEYCIKCHGADKQKGDVRFDIFDDADPDLWKHVLEQITNGDMPPEDEKQPQKELNDKVKAYILKQGGKSAKTVSTGLRRLNKREYENTVRDLLGVNNGIFDPGKFIYEDEVEHGFDTEAEELVISYELLLEYLQSAERSMRVALFADSLDKPESKLIKVSTKKMKGGSGRYATAKPDHIILRVGGNAKIFDGEETRMMTQSGRYKIKVTASETGRGNYDVPLMPKSVPLKLGVGIISELEQGITASGELKGVYELDGEKKLTFELDTWIDSGFHPYISFVNGPRKPVSKIRSGSRRGEIEGVERGSEYLGPGIKVTSYTIEGPFNDEWPPMSYKVTYANDKVPNLNNANVRAQVLKAFVWRSCRRPVPDSDIAPYTKFLNAQYKETGDWQEALIRTFSAVMGSIDFLYIREGQGELNDFELASRLSYLLWSTMPDKELFALANSGQLRDPAVFKKQILRFLDDPRAAQFTRSFVDQWLSVDKLGKMPPDIKNKDYKIYYTKGLENSMRLETYKFFEHVLHENKSVRDFIDSDYTFVNNGLAELYDIPFSGGKELEKVEIPSSSKRGGLLGHASVLTLTANGVETSPVERGHWVLDEFLGTPPPPAPEEVPALVPDLLGATTVREQLVKHREDVACMTCHKKMDPPGFALESFDPIGRFRTKYENKNEVTSNGTFLGEDFKDIDGLKKLLMKQDKVFARSLMIKFAEYAKGRKLNIADLAIVDRLLRNSAMKDYAFRDMLISVMTSELMTHR